MVGTFFPKRWNAYPGFTQRYGVPSMAAALRKFNSMFV